MTGSRSAATRGPDSTPWPLGRVIGVAVLLMALFSLAAVVVGGLALDHLDHERQRIESTLDPAALASQQLYSALLNQETGVRGYALSGQTAFLAPYNEGYAAEKVAAKQLQQLTPQQRKVVRTTACAALLSDDDPQPLLGNVSCRRGTAEKSE